MRHFSERIPVVKRCVSVLLTITSGHFTYQTQLLVSDGKKESITPSSETSLTLTHFKVRFTKDLTEAYVHLTAIHTFFQKSWSNLKILNFIKGDLKQVPYWGPHKM